MQSSAPSLEPPAESRATLQRRARHCRITSVVILLLGAVSAGVVYWLGSRAQDLPDDPAMLGFDRAARRQMGLLYGKQGQLIEGLNDWLKQPGAQALLIIVAAVIVAGGFFLAARVAETEAADAETDPPPGSN